MRILICKLKLSIEGLGVGLGGCFAQCPYDFSDRPEFQIRLSILGFDFGLGLDLGLGLGPVNYNQKK